MSSIAPFVRSSDEAVKAMLQVAAVKPGELLFDLGSGDGRILIAAAKIYRAKAIGIEIREDLVKESRSKVQELGLNGLVQIVHGDFMKSDLKTADVVTLYLTTNANGILAPKLEKELKPGCRVVSHQFEIPGWSPSRIYTEGNFRIYLYVR